MIEDVAIVDYKYGQNDDAKHQMWFLPMTQWPKGLRSWGIWSCSNLIHPSHMTTYPNPLTSVRILYGERRGRKWYNISKLANWSMEIKFWDKWVTWSTSGSVNRSNNRIGNESGIPMLKNKKRAINNIDLKMARHYAIIEYGIIESHVLCNPKVKQPCGGISTFSSRHIVVRGDHRRHPLLHMMCWSTRSSCCCICRKVKVSIMCIQ